MNNIDFKIGNGFDRRILMTALANPLSAHHTWIQRQSLCRFIVTIYLLLSVSISWANEQHADKNTIDVVVLETMDNPIVLQSCRAFVAELSKLLPEKDIKFIVRNADGSLTSAKTMLDDVIQTSQPDLLVSVATLGTRAVFDAVKQNNIPAVFMVVSDPVAEGLVDRLGDTSRFNITGKSHVVSSGVKLEMLKRIMMSNPHNHEVHKIALVGSDYPSSANAMEKLIKEADSVPSIEFIPVKFSYLAGSENVNAMHRDIIEKLRNVAHDVDGYWLPPGPAAHDDKLYEEIDREYGIPLLFSEQVSAIKKGALIGVFADEMTIGRNAAVQARQILLGANANDLPIERPKNFVVAININTAISLGFTIPSDILELAKDNVYR